MVRYGDIVLIQQLLDPNGRNPKDRPAVVVTPNAELLVGSSIQIVAISTLVPTPLPADHVLLLWSLPFHPRTGLNKRCAAVCTWISRIDEDRILKPIGFVPVVPLAEIALLLNRASE